MTESLFLLCPPVTPLHPLQEIRDWLKTLDEKAVRYAGDDQPLTHISDAKREAEGWLVDPEHPENQRAIAAVAVLRALLNVTEEGRAADAVLEAPHVGERFSQRQLARKVLAGRSYQAVQGWINREPLPKATAEWLTADLQRVDSRTEDRMIRVLEDEIAIVVKR